MNRMIFRAALCAASLTMIAVPATVAEDAAASEAVVTLGDIEISNAFTRATLPNAPVGGGYVTIANTGESADTLVAVESPVSPNVQLHQMSIVDDVMHMSEVEGGIEIPAGETVTLAPGGLHLMFMQLETAFEEGSTVPVTLTFENAGDIEVDLDIRSATARGGAHQGHGMDLNHPMHEEHGE